MYEEIKEILLYWRCICLAEMSGDDLLFAEFIAEL